MIATTIQFRRAIERARESRRRHVNVTRLWNWVDHQDYPEAYFRMLEKAFPQFYQDTSWGRCHIFAYHDLDSTLERMAEMHETEREEWLENLTVLEQLFRDGLRAALHDQPVSAALALVDGACRGDRHAVRCLGELIREKIGGEL